MQTKLHIPNRLRRAWAFLPLAFAISHCGAALAGEAEVLADTVYAVTVYNVATDGRSQGAFELLLPWNPSVIPGTTCRAPFVTRLADDLDGAMLAVLRKSIQKRAITLRVTDDSRRNVVAGRCSLMAVGRPTQP